MCDDVLIRGVGIGIVNDVLYNSDSESNSN